MELFYSFIIESLRMLYLAAPFLLIGLLAAGFIHVLMPSQWVERWLGQPGLSGVIKAALVGVPLPICSCGVVPIAVELRRKKASDPANLSFLTTTPESGVDSILFTWALMGPVMAIVRPLAAFVTALVTGALAIAYLPLSRLGKPEGDGVDETPDSEDGAGAAENPVCDHDHSHGHSHRHHDHDHGLGYAESGQARSALVAYVLSLFRDPTKAARVTGDAQEVGETQEGFADGNELQGPQPGAASTDAGVDPSGAAISGASQDEGSPLSNLWRQAVRPALRYGFGELLDELAFWLVAGVALAGLLSAVLPADLDALGLGSGLVPMLVMLGVGVPLYVCASASTPIAAALMLKGLSPGAALVFLLAGPATNAASLIVLGRTFGRRFVQVYLAGVILGSLAAGFALDAAVSFFDWRLNVPLLEAQNQQLLGPVGLVSFALISYLLFASGRRGAMKAGWADLRTSLRGLIPSSTSTLRSRRFRGIAVAALVVLSLLGWLATGFVAIPPESRGNPILFGALGAENLGPGLHWHWPAPIGEIDVRRQHYPRKADVGFSTDMAEFALGSERRRLVKSEAWHSPVASMHPRPEQASFLTADENLLEMSFSVHYSLSDPSAFFYRVDHALDFIELYAEAAARRFLAGKRLDELFTYDRPSIETAIAQQVQQRLDALDVGIRVDRVCVVDIHPPGPSVFWFRDVSSSLDDKQTIIHQARRQEAERLPLARGEAALTVAEAEAVAASRVHEATAEAESFSVRVDAISGDREILQHLLWLEASEKHLAGREKIVIPSSSAPRSISLWRTAPQQ